MTTLHDQLEHVADLGGAGHPVPQAELLWQRGHRWRNLRRAGTTVLVGGACLAVIGLGLAGLQSSQQDELRPAGAPAGLPDRVWRPSPTLPGTDSTGPLGRIAIVLSADRAGWWGSESRPVGISAETGAYAFLDLPRWAYGHALSPDGRHVAYWVTGTPSDSPPEGGVAITGFAVYDTSAGESRIQEVPTKHSIDPGELTWADDSTLVASLSQRAGGRDDSDMDQSTGFGQPKWVWRLEEAEAVPDATVTPDPVGGGHGLIWWYGDGALRVAAPRDPGTAIRSIPLDRGVMANVFAVDATGTRGAGVTGDKSPSHVTWASIEDGPQGQVRESRRTFQVLAWIDDSRLLLLQSPALVGPSKALRGVVRLVDIETGKATELTSPVGPTGTPDDFSPFLFSDTSIAWELAAEPTFDASKPPDPIAQRTLVGWSVAAVGAALIALLFWRRRVEP